MRSREGTWTDVRRVYVAGWHGDAHVAGWQGAAITLRCHRRGLSSARDLLFPHPTDANDCSGDARR